MTKKQAFIAGYEDGFIVNTVIFLKDNKQQNTALKSLPTSVKSISLEGLVEMVDNFYRDKKNANIPIGYILLMVRNQLVGGEQKKIDDYLIYLRRRFGPFGRTFEDKLDDQEDYLREREESRDTK